MIHRFDCIILGAGINGCGIARALSLAGKQVLVIDKGKIGSGTSSKTSRLIHGGLRYLENLDILLVKESLNNREKLLSLYPDIVQIVPFFLPVYKNSKRGSKIIRLGLFLYNMLDTKKRGVYYIDKGEFETLFKYIKTEDLRAIYRYYDGKTNDLTLVRRVAEDAKSNSAIILEDTDVNGISINNNLIKVNAGGVEYATNVFINATGPWIDEVRDKYSLPGRYRTVKVSGIHIEVGFRLVPYPLFLQTDTRRILFIIPESEVTIIGTTERLELGCCDHIRIKDEDILYLIYNVNRYLKMPLKKSDVTGAFIGVRALIGHKGNLSSISRSYKLDFHEVGENRIINVYGGKLTTFLSLSQRVVNFLYGNGGKKVNLF